MKNQQGFTLIEMLIAVAILGILASVAVLQYQNHVARAQLNEATVLLGDQKIAVGLFFGQQGYLPRTNEDVNLTNSGRVQARYVDSLNIDNGKIIAKFKIKGTSSKIAGAYMAYVPIVTSSEINWQCYSDLDQKYLPVKCIGNTTQSSL